MHPVLFRIPGIDWPLHTYGLLIVSGFLFAMFVGWREAKRQNRSVDEHLEEEVLDFAFWALLGGMIGARVVFIVVNWRDYANNPLSILMFWKGGLVFYGAAIGGFLAFVFFARKRGYGLQRSLMLADIIVIGVPLAHVFGRFGCVAAGCCWGMEAFEIHDGVISQTIPIAARFPEGALAYSSLLKSSAPDVVALMRETGETMPLFPSQLVEAFGESLVFLSLMMMRTRKWFHGQILLGYGILYPILRFTLEFFRGDAERGVYFLSTSQFISLAVASASLIAIFILRARGMATFRRTTSSPT